MLFQTFFIGSGLSLWERCCLRSFVDHGHEIVVYCYQKFDLPEGVQWAPARDIVSDVEREKFFAQAPGEQARFADLFRYILLSRKGGWWVDTDVLCLSNDVPKDDVVLGWESDTLVCNAIMRLPAGFPFLAEAIEFSWENRNVDVWTYIGPQLLTRLVREYDLTKLVLAPSVLYPVHFSSAFDLIDPDSRTTIQHILRNAPFLHFWHTMFRRVGFQTNFLPPQGSYLADAFARHGAEGVPSLDADAARRHMRVSNIARDATTAVSVLRAELERLRSAKAEN